MENSVQRRFAASDGGISCINCTSHLTENLYRYKKTSAIRASDDFYPDREYSHTVHIINVVSLGNCLCTPAPISSSLILTIRRTIHYFFGKFAYRIGTCFTRSILQLICMEPREQLVEGWCMFLISQINTMPIC